MASTATTTKKIIENIKNNHENAGDDSARNHMSLQWQMFSISCFNVIELAQNIQWLNGKKTHERMKRECVPHGSATSQNNNSSTGGLHFVRKQ